MNPFPGTTDIHDVDGKKDQQKKTILTILTDGLFLWEQHLVLKKTNKKRICRTTQDPLILCKFWVGEKEAIVS